MRCPRCGHWNKASFPRCFQCGEPLNANDEKKPAWREQFETPQSARKRVVFYDSSALPVEEETARKKIEEEAREEETLAAEMTRLKKRRARGSAFLEEVRRNAAEQGIAPSGAGVTIRRSGGYFEEMPDDPKETVYGPGRRGRPRGRPGAPARDNPPFDEDGDWVSIPLETGAAGASMDAEDVPPSFDDPLPISPPAAKKKRKRRRVGAVSVAVWSVRLLTLIVASFIIWQGILMFQSIIGAAPAVEARGGETVEETTIDGMPAHRIIIPGEEGTQYYISELTKSYVVIGGVATIEVPDYVFYENKERLDTEKMDAILTPTMIKGSTETRIAPIMFPIEIPLSPIELISPEVTYIEVVTSVYNLMFTVMPGSKVMVNGRDITDAVDKNGKVSDNPPIKAIGLNYVTITVRAPYCRENNQTITFYREPQEIPLELAADTDMNSRKDTFEINATTITDATITVETPYTSLDLTNIGKTGEFKVVAKLERVGYNTIRLRASYPGKKDSVVEHIVYYLPSVEEYSKKAWRFTALDYKELLANLPDRIRKAQIYECKGIIQDIIADSPQLAIMDTGTDGKEQLVMLQNESSITWIVGNRYRVYADVSGLYNEIPRLTGRFTYDITVK